jgi:hypothetical protein
MNVWIAQAGDGWRAVYPCPDAAGMKVFRENRARSDPYPAAATH